MVQITNAFIVLIPIIIYINLIRMDEFDYVCCCCTPPSYRSWNDHTKCRVIESDVKSKLYFRKFVWEKIHYFLMKDSIWFVAFHIKAGA